MALPDAVAARIVLINCTGETLTSSGSGGISTWLQGVATAAAAQGTSVPVITKRHPQLPTSLPGAVVLDYPSVPAVRGGAYVDRRVRGALGYPHLLQPLWNRRVIEAVAALGPPPRSLVLHNDPELAVVLARHFPQHQVAHLLHNTNDLAPRWRRSFDRRVLPLAISDFIGLWCREAFGLSREVSIVASGVDTSLFAPGAKDATPTVITYSGLFNERKGPDLLLRAAQRLVGRVPPFELRLFGSTHYGSAENDPYGRRLEVLSGELRAMGVLVEFPGFLSRVELAQALRSSAVHVVPSRWQEPFGLVALEGMAAGAAVVVADTGGLASAVGPPGLTFRPGSDDELAQRLASLLNAPEQLRHRQEAARRWAEQHTWADTWRQLLQALGSRL